jgi:hypothetical protein
MARKKEYKDYADYLKSPKWRQVKKDYASHEQTDECILCFIMFDDNNKPHYHHYKYSTDWNNDTWENLIIVCDKCHKILHEYINHDDKDISIREYLKSAHYHLQHQRDLDKWVEKIGYQEFVTALLKDSKIKYTFVSEEHQFGDDETVNPDYVHYKGSINFKTYKSVHDRIKNMFDLDNLSMEF